MKITCPACSASYRIPDEKVQGKNKVFKIGCKRCSAEIRVRGIATDEDLGRTTLPFQMELPDTAATTPQRVWFAGIDGKQVGPLTEGEVIEHIGAGRLKADDLVWRKGFGAWTPVREVAPFQDRLADENKPADAEPAKRKSPRRAQTLELSAAMIELLVKLDAQGGKSEAEAAGEPPQFPNEDAAGAPPALQAGAAAPALPEIPDSGEDFVPVMADEDEPPAVPAADVPPAVPTAAAAAVASVAAPAAASAKSAAEQPPVVPGSSDAGKGRRSPTKVTLPGRAEAQANAGDDAATKVEAMPVAEPRAAAGKAVETKAAPATATKPGAKAEAKPAETKPADTKGAAAKTGGAAAAKPGTAARPAGPAGAPAVKKKDEGGLGVGLIIGLVVVAAAVGGGALYMSKKGKAGPQVKASANPVAVAPTPATPAKVEPPPAKPEPAPAPAQPAVAAVDPAVAAAAATAPGAGEPGKIEAAAAAGDPAKVEPATEAAKADQGATEPSKADSAKADSAKADSAKADSVKAATRTDVAKAEPARNESTKTDTAKAESGKAASKGDPMDAIDVIIAKQKAAKEAAERAAAKPPEPPKSETKAAAGPPDDLDKLLAAQKAKREAAKMTAKPDPEDEPAGGGGGAKLSQGDVDKIAVGARSDVLRCYMTHADIDGGAETIRVDLYVAAAGNVSNVKIKGKHGSGEIGSCITSAVKKLHFPQGSGATQKYTVRYAVGG